jgi:WD40 repeat protein
LDGSEWFVLLLSEDAAQSEWVNQEITYWTEHKDPSQILPVVTDGEFGWADGDIDVSSTAAPPALSGVFAEEPRWVDLRWARTDTDLDLSNSRFSDAIADVASAIRGVPKDELESEEVRQHRRTIRTAWAAGVVVLLLGIAATVGAIVAVGQSNEALEERSRAQSQALAAASLSVLDADPELAQILAVLSIRQAPGEVEVESLRAMRLADEANLLRLRIPFPPTDFLHVTADGSTILAAVNSPPEVAAFDLESGEQLWRHSFEDLYFWLWAMAPDPTGGRLVVAGLDNDRRRGHLVVLSASSGEILEVLTEDCAPGWHPGDNPFSADGAVVALSSGTENCATEPSEAWVSFRDPETWAETGRYFLSDAKNVPNASFSANGETLVVSDMESVVEVLSYPDLEVIHRFEGQQIQFLVESPDGQRLAMTLDGGIPRLRLLSAMDGQFFGFAEERGPFLTGVGAAFSPSGDRLAVLTREGINLVRARDGKLLYSIGPTSAAFGAVFSPDGASLVTTGDDGISVWNLEEESPLNIDGARVSWFNPDALIEGQTSAAVGWIGPLVEENNDIRLLLIDSGTGSTVRTPSAAQLPDGRFVVLDVEPAGKVPEGAVLAGQDEFAIEGLSLLDPLTQTSQAITTCPVLMSETAWFSESPTVTCPNGDPVYGLHTWGLDPLAVSPDGSHFAASSALLEGANEVCQAEGSSRRAIGVWQVDGPGSVELSVDGCLELLALGADWVALRSINSRVVPGRILDFEGRRVAELGQRLGDVSEVTADGGYLITIRHGADVGAQVIVFDTSTWTEVASWEAHSAILRGMAISPDGTRLATAAEDELVRIWDLTSVLSGGLEAGDAPAILDELPTGTASDVGWRGGSALDVFLRTGAVITYSLNPAELVERVLERLTRSLTPAECRNFRIDPCPTLEELRRG